MLGGGEASVGDIPSLGAAAGQDFRMIRTGTLAQGDYNVDNIQFDPETDGNNPELLAELEHLQLGGDDDKESDNYNEVENDDISCNEKEENNNTVTATAALEQEIPLPQDQLSEINMLKKMALEAKQSGNMEQARALMTQIIQLESSDGGGSNASANGKKGSANSERKRMLTRFIEQAKECKEAAKTFLDAGDRTTAADHLRKAKAFEVDMRKIHDLPALEIMSVPVELPLDHLNRQVEDGTLLLRFSNLKVNNSKCKVKAGSFVFAAILEWPLYASESQHCQFTPPFPITNVNEKMDPESSKLDMTLHWTGVKRELKCAKFFEHHKLGLELQRKESSFFRTKFIPIGHANLRMSMLVNLGRLEERVEFVDEQRKSLGVSVLVTLMTRMPLSPKAPLSLVRTVEWMVLVGGETGRIFGFNPPDPEKPSTEQVDDPVKDIVSYVVLEEEITRLKADQASATDPIQLGLLMAMENKLDALTVAVDLGQLQMDQYLQRVRDAIPVAKKNALKWKRAGNLVEARRWLQHVHLMENEIKEGEEATDQ